VVIGHGRLRDIETSKAP